MATQIDPVRNAFGRHRRANMMTQGSLVKCYQFTSSSRKTAKANSMNDKVVCSEDLKDLQPCIHTLVQDKQMTDLRYFYKYRVLGLFKEMVQSLCIGDT